ncbi:MAG TPA: amino acid ABC transporter ATP-binding protein [Burkholderiales bacterium]|nr:amino acid ABC transporter ATP-binding protein [Burkholderiales bacterium]
MSPIVSVRGVTKRYGETEVLRGVDLDIAPGQTVSIIGPSGSGKSTLLRLLMTLDAPDAGTITIDGEAPWAAGSTGRGATARLRRARERVGMVFQHYNLFPHMTALGNVMEAPVRVLGLARDAAEARARGYLERVGLDGKAGSYPAQLSGGQRQRVAIARALAMEPRVMLFDEITSALDPELVGGILALLRELAESGTMTLLIVTHHMKFAEASSDRVLFFDRGVIVEDAAPAAMFGAPRDERVRRFIDAVSAVERGG